MKIDEFINIDPKTLNDEDLIERYNLCVNYLVEQTEVVYMTSPEESFLKNAQSEITSHPLSKYLTSIQEELVNNRKYRPSGKKLKFYFQKVEA